MGRLMGGRLQIRTYPNGIEREDYDLALRAMEVVHWWTYYCFLQGSKDQEGAGDLSHLHLEFQGVEISLRMPHPEICLEAAMRQRMVNRKWKRMI